MIYANVQGKTYVITQNDENLNSIQWININVEELQILIGVLIASCSNCGRKVHRQTYGLKMLFSSNHILLHIRFGDPEIRYQKRELSHNPLEAIHPIYDEIVNNCLDNYSSNTNVIDDECLATFRNKPGRYGIKILVIAGL